MALQAKLFSHDQISVGTPSIAKRSRYNREYLITPAIADSLNTYKNFGIFPTHNDIGETEYDKNNSYAITDKSKSGTPGVRSIFNVYNAVLTGDDYNTNLKINPEQNMQAAAMNNLIRKISQFRYNNNAPLLDTAEIRNELRPHMAVSVKDLIKTSRAGGFGRNVYSYADFMYCKHLGKVPNNYLITVRRFPAPVTDSIMPFGRHSSRRSAEGRAEGFHPIGTMVTWLGVSGNEMNSILSYTFKMPFTFKKAGWEQVQKMGGGESGVLNAMEAMINPATRAHIAGGGSNPAYDSFVGKFFGGRLGAGPYPQAGTFVDSNKVYGPIDRIKGNYQRSEDGLEFDQKFDLVFEYELRAYNGINPRSAMLDLIGNILNVTYINGGFWAGGYRGGGMGQSSAFRNLNIFKCHGGFTDFMDALSKDISNASNKIKRASVAAGSPWELIKQCANAIGGMLIGGLLNNLGRPAKYAANSLLSEAPVGLWHITIGNPHAPILTMGNMILLNTKIEHSGPLGLDDFPTDLKVTMSFERGKPRDQWGIEYMYMQGNDRIQHSMSRYVKDMYDAAQTYKGPNKGTAGNNVSEHSTDGDLSASNATEQTEYEQNVVGGNTSSKTSSEMKNIENDGTVLEEVFGAGYDIQAIIWSAQEMAEGSAKAKGNAPADQASSTRSAKEAHIKDM